MPAAKTPAKVLSIDDILAVEDLPTDTVACPEWGGVVTVRALSRHEVVQALQACIDEDGLADQTKLQMEFVWRGMSLTPDRVAQLDKKHPRPLKRINDKVREMSGIDEDDRFPDA